MEMPNCAINVQVATEIPVVAKNATTGEYSVVQCGRMWQLLPKMQPLLRYKNSRIIEKQYAINAYCF